jgi:hypothetical protein
MKRFMGALFLVAGLLAIASNAWSAEAGKSAEGAKPAAKPAMSHYLVISPHTPEECLKTLDEASAMGADQLKMWRWGCASGDHTGYLMVMAANETDALSKVPASVRDKAKAMKVDTFTPAQIKAMHEKKM